MNHIYKAMEKERDKSIWEMWLMFYPHMKNPIWIDEFREKMLEPKVEKVQSDEAMFEAVKLLNSAWGGKVVEV